MFFIDSTAIDWILPGATLVAAGNSSLFEVMRQHDIDHIKVPVLYKDIKNRWYKTICTIDRDVLHTRDGWMFGYVAFPVVQLSLPQDY